MSHSTNSTYSFSGLEVVPGAGLELAYDTTLPEAVIKNDDKYTYLPPPSVKSRKSKFHWVFRYRGLPLIWIITFTLGVVIGALIAVAIVSVRHSSTSGSPPSSSTVISSVGSSSTFPSPATTSLTRSASIPSSSTLDTAITSSGITASPQSTASSTGSSQTSTGSLEIMSSTMQIPTPVTTTSSSAQMTTIMSTTSVGTSAQNISASIGARLNILVPDKHFTPSLAGLKRCETLDIDFKVGNGDGRGLMFSFVLCMSYAVPRTRLSHLVASS
jgi:hypothetical protein